MRESRTSGSVGRAPGNRCLYPEVLTSPIIIRYSQCIAGTSNQISFTDITMPAKLFVA